MIVRGTDRMAPSSTVRNKSATGNRTPQITGVNGAQVGTPKLVGDDNNKITKPSVTEQTALRSRLARVAATIGNGNRGGRKPPTGSGGAGPGKQRAANDNTGTSSVEVQAKQKAITNPAPTAIFPKLIGTPKASEVEQWAKAQGWKKKAQTADGPLTHVDSNGF